MKEGKYVKKDSTYSRVQAVKALKIYIIAEEIIVQRNAIS